MTRNQGRIKGRISSPLRVVVVTLLVLAGLAVGGETVAAQAAGGGPEAGTADWASVSAGGGYTCGIRTTGRLYCWGTDYGSFGFLGTGVAPDSRTTPTEVVGGFTDWTAVAAGITHTCGRRSTGRLYCWGNDDNGQVGNGATTGRQPSPVEVAGGFTDWTNKVAIGSTHTCAIRTGGRLFCWGGDSDGQVGNGAATGDQPSPVEVAGSRTDWAKVAAGDNHTCARRSTGRLFCWGNDGNGQVGNGATTGDQSSPVQVVGNRTDWTAVTTGGSHTCARRSTGRLFCWGANGTGQLGIGNPGDRHRPVEVAGGRTDWTGAIDAGSVNHTCARRSTGRLFCWGASGNGQLGNGNAANQFEMTPDQVAGNRTDWTRVSTGGYHTCARRSTGRLFCWGTNTDGQLGTGGGPSDQDQPVEVAA